MKSELFVSWLVRLNTRMRDDQRSILLLVDNASSHRCESELSPARLLRLPPNTTAVLQPQEAQIIQS